MPQWIRQVAGISAELENTPCAASAVEHEVAREVHS